MSLNNIHLADRLAEFVRQLSSDPTVSADAQVEIVANVKLPGRVNLQPASVVLQTIDLHNLEGRDRLRISTAPTCPTDGLETPHVPSPGRTTSPCVRKHAETDTVGTIANWSNSAMSSLTGTPDPVSSLRKRRRLDQSSTHDSVATMEKLIQSIWTQIHDWSVLATDSELCLLTSTILERANGSTDTAGTSLKFLDVTQVGLQITTSTRTTRAVEVLVQTDWMRRYLTRRDSIKVMYPQMKQHEVNRLVLSEACKVFSWTEKELRNHICIWKGYLDLQKTAGWAALVFAGPGLYKFCKYRAAFDRPALETLSLLRTRFEVAADTLHPQWRKLLALVGEATQPQWTGHPHDWSVSIRSGTDPPLPLAVTYHQWDPDFSFQHLQECIIDRSKWPDKDPRIIDPGPTYTCQSCGLAQISGAKESVGEDGTLQDIPSSGRGQHSTQSQSANDAQSPCCTCFPTIFSPHIIDPPPTPVQIFRTPTGKNNGLIALLPFPPNTAITQFLGLITHSLTHTDVMQPAKPSSAVSTSTTSTSKNNLPDPPYQISQSRHGNLTRFINHSCHPNSEFRNFSWRGIQRVLVVTGPNGVNMGEEVTVDYSAGYWEGLDKRCLCGESGCRYQYRYRYRD